ncbi:MAG: hypothetical protein WC784_05835 [Candidatus Shapirobacteria bacterium]|jgi:hypothetical protein
MTLELVFWTNFISFVLLVLCFIIGFEASKLDENNRLRELVKSFLSLFLVIFLECTVFQVTEIIEVLPVPLQLCIPLSVFYLGFQMVRTFMAGVDRIKFFESHKNINYFRS